jgi:hypothetical protein
MSPVRFFEKTTDPAPIIATLIMANESLAYLLMATTDQQEADSKPRRRKWKRWVALTVVIAIALYVCIPRRADLRGFDPSRLAALETGMWRDYYQHKRLPLAIKLYRVSREQYGFSPLDSVRLGWHAAKAAIAFKDSKSDGEADRALPELRKYFAIIAKRVEPTFDVDAANRAELHWWKIRRHEGVGPVEYGHEVARATAILYHVSPESIEPYAQLRAAAMDYRDERGQRMTDADWEKVRAMLDEAFKQLKGAVGVSRT